MNEISSQTETLADRLNSEPVIFRGSTNSELGVIALVAALFWLPFSVLIGTLIGKFFIAVGLSAVGVLATIFFGSTLFQRIKRGKPDFYYQHVVIIKLQRMGLRASQLILRNGLWSLGRD